MANPRVSASLGGLLVPMVLALCALLLGLSPAAVFSLMDIARPGMQSAAAVAGVMQGALTPAGFWTSAGPVLAVALLVALILMAGRSKVGQAAVVVGRGLAGFEAMLREWRVAGALLLLILLALGWAAMG
jgi:hypothetical protein